MRQFTDFWVLQDILKLCNFAPEIEKERGDDCHSRAQSCVIPYHASWL